MTDDPKCYILKDDHEIPCELKDVKGGDHFRMEGETSWSVADGDARQATDGGWYVLLDKSFEKSGPVEIPLEDTVEQPSDTLSIKVTRRDGSTDVIKS